jgi:hypothetical protein
MARLAAVPVFQRGLEMRRIFEIAFEKGFVASCTGIRPNVFGRFLAGLVVRAAGNRRTS